MRDLARHMGRNYRMIFKWCIIVGIAAILLKLLHHGVVNIFLSGPTSLIGDRTDSRVNLRYEDFLTAWAKSGQHSKSGKLAMEKIQTANNLQLIGAQIFFRHGARTPLHLLPSLKEVIYSKEHIDSYLPTKWDIQLIKKEGDAVISKENISSTSNITGDLIEQLKAAPGLNAARGQLTSIGEKQLFQLGRLIRKELINEKGNGGLIPAIYDPKYVYCRSTYVTRTICSARSFLAGLFSSEQADNKIQANGPFEIEVHQLLYEDLFPNSNLYPVLKNSHSATALYLSLNDDHELKKARQALLNHIGVNETSHGIVELYDEVVSRLAHNFPVPDDILQLVKEFEVMSGREIIYRSTNIGYDPLIRSTAGSMLYMIRENFNTTLQNHLNKKQEPYQKMFIYSGHDTTIIPLAMALEIFDMRWPRYASYIFLKYYISTTNASETYVTVTYNDEPQVLPNCENYYCPYSTFLKNLQNRFEQPKNGKLR